MAQELIFWAIFLKKLIQVFALTYCNEGGNNSHGVLIKALVCDSVSSSMRQPADASAVGNEAASAALQPFFP